MEANPFQACVVIPTYNAGPLLQTTVESVLPHAPCVIVAVDGSSDGSDRGLAGLARCWPGLHVLSSPRNEGKGVATLRAMAHARSLGYTHAAVFDSDGQHCAQDLPRFLELARTHPHSMILGKPVFGTDAPWERVWARKLGNWCTHLETLWGGVGDSLFGFRVYPLDQSLAVMAGVRGGSGFDFDTQLVVRLAWAGVRPVNVPTRVRYYPCAEGGRSHFRYLSDTFLLAQVHFRLLCEAARRFPELLRLRRRR